MGLSDVPNALLKVGKESVDFTRNQSKQLFKTAMKGGKKRRKSSKRIKRRTHRKRRKQLARARVSDLSAHTATGAVR